MNKNRMRKFVQDYSPTHEWDGDNVIMWVNSFMAEEFFKALDADADFNIECRLQCDSIVIDMSEIFTDWELLFIFNNLDGGNDE